MELTLYSDPSAFPALRGEWNSLLHRSRFDTIFLTWEWQSDWWACLGSARGPLYLLAARDAGRLIGILPLYATDEPDGRTLHLVGCVEVSDYLDFIVEAGQEERVYAAFLDWLAGPDAPPWDAVDLCNQPEASLAYRLLPGMAQDRGWTAAVTQEDVCPIAPLSGTFDGYLESLDKKQRHEIRRKLRRMEREAPDYRVRYVTGGDAVAPAMEEFIRLHRESRQDKDAFMTGQMQSFFHSIAEVTAQREWLRLAFLDIAGQPAAAYFCFTYGRDLLIYNSGYDPGAYLQLSPGWVLLAEMIRQAIAEEMTRVDFLQGNEDYKYRFGGVDTPVYRTVIRRAPQ